MKLHRSMSLAAVAAVTAGLLPALVTSPAQAAGPAQVQTVTTGNISVDGSSGWREETDGIGTSTGTGAFVNGPGTPPLGLGSYTMVSHAVGDKAFLHLTGIDGTPLQGVPTADLSTLAFDSRSTSATDSPYLNIAISSARIDSDSNGIPGPGTFASFVYVPASNGGQPANTWTSHNALDPAAKWWVSRQVIASDNTVISRGTQKTWSQWQAILDDAVIHPQVGSIQWIVGDTTDASWVGVKGSVDNLQVATTSLAATYDLEEGLGECPVVIDAPSDTFTMTADCTTSTSLSIRDGWTLNGAGHTITAVDPSPAVNFTGAVLTNEAVSGGARMDLSSLHLVGDLRAGCNNDLNGVLFSNAAGSLTDSTVADIRRGAGSGCQGGNSISIDNNGPDRLAVTVDDVAVTGFQKTGIRANGNIALRLTDSSVADAKLDLVTASNSLQVSRGARAYVAHNTFGGNDWDGNDLWSASGVILYGAEDVTFIRNVVEGDDTDVALSISAAPGYTEGTATITCNLFSRDEATDSTPAAGTPMDLWNTGVAADEALLANVNATGNTVVGFATPYENVVNETGGPCASGPVHDLSLSADSTSVTATWTAPEALPYAPVTGYDVTLTPGGDTQTVTATTATFAVPAGKDVTITVVPVNAAGAGTARSASLDTALPARPEDLSIYGSKRYGALTWTPPSPPSPVTSYTVTATPITGTPVSEVISAAGLTFPVKVNGLATNTTYTFTVRATNAFGSGPAATKTMHGAVTTATFSPTSMVYGKSVTVKGKVIDADTGKPVAGQTMYLFGKTKGSTSYSNRGPKATTAANGTYSFTIKPHASRRYYVTSRGPDRMGASSVSSYVKVKATITMKLDDSSVKAGTRVYFSGKVKPKQGSLVQLQRKQGSSWVVKKTMTPAASGAYAISWKPKSKKDYTWRVRVFGPTFSAAVSKTKLLVVT